MREEWKRQTERITKISKSLRKEFYDNNEDEEGCFFTPSGVLSGYGEQYDMVQSLGAWPEFILRGTFCRRTFKGYCSPCFYSQYSLKKRADGENFRTMVRKQVTYIIENFEEEVYKRQYTWKYLNSIDKRKIEFAVCPTGSYFDEKEFPQDLRIQMLQELCKISEKYDEPIHLIVESHCEDWLALDFNGENTKEELILLQKLNATVIFGFESANEYVRNVLYNKHLSIDDVKRAHALIENHKLKMGVFIFAGLFSMNDYLTYEDVTTSIEFAVSRGISPAIMFQNIQTNTINEILFNDNKISLIEPFTVMNIISKMIDICERYGNITEWFIADPKGGPPTPEYNIFDCAILTPEEYSKQIYNAVVELRKKRDFAKFQEFSSMIRQTNEYEKYKAEYRCQYKCEELERKTSELLDSAEKIIEDRGFS